jgi:hypothetical protein
MSWETNLENDVRLAVRSLVSPSNGTSLKLLVASSRAYADRLWSAGSADDAGFG